MLLALLRAGKNNDTSLRGILLEEQKLSLRKTLLRRSVGRWRLNRLLLAGYVGFDHSDRVGPPAEESRHRRSVGRYTEFYALTARGKLKMKSRLELYKALSSMITL
jgi:hypothetical protein